MRDFYVINFGAPPKSIDIIRSDPQLKCQKRYTPLNINKKKVLEHHFMWLCSVSSLFGNCTKSHVIKIGAPPNLSDKIRIAP